VVRDEDERLHEHLRRLSNRELARMLMIDSSQYRDEALVLGRTEAKRRGFTADILETELTRIAWSAAPRVAPVTTRTPGWLEKTAPEVSFIAVLLLASLMIPQPRPPRTQNGYWEHALLQTAELGVRLLLFR